MMMLNEYLLFERRRLSLIDPWPQHYDLFISAHTSSARVASIAERISADRQARLVLPEYDYASPEWPADSFVSLSRNEGDYFAEFIDWLDAPLEALSVAVDITGLIGHYLAALLAVLRARGARRCDFYYAEPQQYALKERTAFSDEAVLEVRQISGFEGVHTIETDHDLLILAVGYDHRLVVEVASRKEHARKLALYGLPSLRLDMYQESLLRIAQASEALGPEASLPANFVFAPANDPFATASTVSELVKGHLKKYPKSNIYLAPLSTKPQTLGLALFYQLEGHKYPCSMIAPICGHYERETSTGVSTAWLYRLDLV